MESNQQWRGVMLTIQFSDIPSASPTSLSLLYKIGPNHRLLITWHRLMDFSKLRCLNLRQIKTRFNWRSLLVTFQAWIPLLSIFSHQHMHQMIWFYAFAKCSSHSGHWSSLLSKEQDPRPYSMIFSLIMGRLWKVLSSSLFLRTRGSNRKAVYLPVIRHSESCPTRSAPAWSAGSN